METFRAVLLLLWIALGSLTLFGLIRPWYALWWSAQENRLMVLRYYGIPFVIAYAVWWLTGVA